MKETIIILKYPANGKTTLTLKRPTENDRIAAANNQGDPAEIELHLFSKLSGLSLDEINNLDFFDYIQLQTAYKAFTWN